MQFWDLQSVANFNNQEKLAAAVALAYGSSKNQSCWGYAVLRFKVMLMLGQCWDKILTQQYNDGKPAVTVALVDGNISTSVYQINVQQCAQDFLTLLKTPWGMLIVESKALEGLGTI